MAKVHKIIKDQREALCPCVSVCASVPLWLFVIIASFSKIDRTTGRQLCAFQVRRQTTRCFLPGGRMKFWGKSNYQHQRVISERKPARHQMQRPALAPGCPAGGKKLRKRVWGKLFRTF